MPRQKLLLWLVALLLLIKVVVLPSFQYVDAQREVLQTKLEKHQKETALIAQKESIDQQIEDLDRYLKTMTERLFSTDSVEEGSLLVQKLVEDKASEHNISVTRFTWLSPTEDNTDLHTLQLFVEGSPTDWIAFQKDIESAEWINLKKMTFYYSRSSTDRLIGDVSGMLSYQVNFWVDANENI